MASRARRILIVIGQLARGGAERQVHELATRLDRRSYLPTVVTFESGGHYQPLLESAGVEVVVLDKSGWRETTAPLRLARIMRTREIDLVHAFLLPAYWRALIGAQLAGVRAVACAVRSTRTWERARHRFIEAAALRHARVVLANSPAVRDHIIAQAGVPPERVRLIMNGVDTIVFHPGAPTLRARWIAPGGTGEGDEGPIVGFVGSLREAKDPRLFIRIASTVIRTVPATRFLVVGDGPLRAELEEMGRATGLGERLIFAGERSDIPEVLRSVDLLAVTSVREGCCNVILEAMATGLPVIATAVGGNPDLITHGQNGWLFPHQDAATGAAGMARILTDGALRRRLGDAGLESARQRFSIESMVRATGDLYEELA